MKIIVLAGGLSTERDVSLSSAAGICRTLVEKGLIASESLGISCQEMLNSFKNGEVAFLHGGPWQYTELKESGVNFKMLPQLSETGENEYVLGGPAACFGINVNTENHDGAEAALTALASV